MSAVAETLVSATLASERICAIAESLSGLVESITRLAEIDQDLCMETLAALDSIEECSDQMRSARDVVSAKLENLKGEQ